MFHVKHSQKEYQIKKTIYSFILLLGFSLQMQGADLPEGFREEIVADGLDPVSYVFTPDNRILIAEKNGAIRIVKNDSLLPDPFLEIDVDNYNERGISGIAIDPDFETSNYFYVFYTVPGVQHNRVSRFVVNGDYALKDSEEILLDLDQLSGSIHNAGALAFDEEGKLYITSGDGADMNNSQDLNSTLGKILRINPDGSIPEDNPFYDDLNGSYRAIWAYGFRNPFSLTINQESGRIFIGDVGSNEYEEINEIFKGKNYGWPILEGYWNGGEVPDNYVDPIYVYDHNMGCAVTGITSYYPESISFPEEYVGRIFFADYCEGYINMINPDDPGGVARFASNIDRPIHLQVSEAGQLYYIARKGQGGGSASDNTSTNNGQLWKVSYSGSGEPFISQHPESVLVSVGESVEFSVKASGSRPLSYTWYINGEVADTDSSKWTIINVPIDLDQSIIKCKVTNNEGEVWSEEAVLSVTQNTRPIPVIHLPDTTFIYRAGESIPFAGSATDKEDGDLAKDLFTWRIDFHHDDHTHPAMAPTFGIDSGSFEVPYIGETASNVWYRIYLTVEDNEGLSNTTYIDIYPEIINVLIDSEPKGLNLLVDGKRKQTPYTLESVTGILHTVEAIVSQSIGGNQYLFTEWENNSTDRSYPFRAYQDLPEITAYFEEVPLGEGTGLKGEYYNEGGGHLFVGDPVMVRTDAIINFDWMSGSPNEEKLGNNYFSIRWTGEIEPLFTEEYTFYLLSDDGVRLYVDDQLLIDQWIPQPATETSGKISLTGQKRYKIKLEYFEDGGEATVIMYWSSNKTKREVVPKLQLYPASGSSSVEENLISDQILIYPQPGDDRLYVSVSNGSIDLLKVLDLNGKILQTTKISANNAEIDISALPAGMYILQLHIDNQRYTQEFIKR